MDTKFFPCENFEGTFWSHLPPSNLKKEKQELSVKVGCQREPFKAIWRPTSERILPGENLSEWPEITRALRNWPKYFKNHRAENPPKISRGLQQPIVDSFKSASYCCGLRLIQVYPKPWYRELDLKHGLLGAIRIAKLRIHENRTFCWQSLAFVINWRVVTYNRIYLGYL